MSKAAARAVAIVLPRWAKGVGAAEWPAVAAAAARAVLRAPGAAAMVRCAAALAPWTGPPPTSRATISAARQALVAQETEDATSHRPGVSRERRGGTTSEVFERLAPLLLLRTLPLEAWDDDHENETNDGPGGGSVGMEAARTPSVPDLLLRRMLDFDGDGGGEHDEVRRVAAELHGRAHPAASAVPRMEALSAALSRESQSPDGKEDAKSLAEARACMFAWCSALAARGVAALPGEPSPGAASRLRALAVSVLARSAEGGDDTRKAQMGAMETLASLVRAELEAETFSTDTPTATSSVAATEAETETKEKGPAAGGLLEPTPRGVGGDGRLSLRGLYVDPVASTLGGRQTRAETDRRRPLIEEISEGDESSEGGSGGEGGKKGKTHVARREGPTLAGVLEALQGIDAEASAWVRGPVGSSDPDRALQVRLALANVVVLAVRRPMADAEAAAALGDATLPVLARVAAAVEVNVDTATRCAALQAAMVAVAAASSAERGREKNPAATNEGHLATASVRRHASALAACAVAALEDEGAGAQTRLAGARLCTALLAAEDATLTALTASLPAMRSSLTRAARAADSPELADTARRLLQCMEAGG